MIDLCQQDGSIYKIMAFNSIFHGSDCKARLTKMLGNRII